MVFACVVRARQRGQERGGEGRREAGRAEEKRRVETGNPNLA